MPRIRVVNPNSNEAVTRGIDEAVQPLRFAGGPEILCSTLAEGPFGVETQEHVESVTLPLRRLVEIVPGIGRRIVRPPGVTAQLSSREMVCPRRNGSAFRAGRPRGGGWNWRWLERQASVHTSRGRASLANTV